METQLEDLDQFIARTRPMRQYEKYWILLKARGYIVLELEDTTVATRKRWQWAIETEKKLDQEMRKRSKLHFSWVGRMLTVRLNVFR